MEPEIPGDIGIERLQDVWIPDSGEFLTREIFNVHNLKALHLCVWIVTFERNMWCGKDFRKCNEDHDLDLNPKEYYGTSESEPDYESELDSECERDDESEPEYED
ncbi:hypothetical protein HDU77_011043 [Chytriomyces hyalinus]|nr:hypothetical protein HDU77_011043 [Chytriomyces hyalinus]